MLFKYYYTYKLIHLENNEFYYGSRSSLVEPKYDIQYMGSMVTWKPDISKLYKIIIKIHNTYDEMINHEIQLIKEFWNHSLNKNFMIPDKNFNTFGLINVKDVNGNIFKTKIWDNKIQSGELIPTSNRKFSFINNNGNIEYLHKWDIKVLSGEFKFIKSKKLKTINFGKVPVKDKNGIQFFVEKTDIRYLYGELVHIRKGKIMPNKIKKIKEEELIKIEYEKSINEKIEKISNLKIDFSKSGWVKECSKILNIKPQKVCNWMRNNMNLFYNEKCFKRKGTNIEKDTFQINKIQEKDSRLKIELNLLKNSNIDFRLPRGQWTEDVGKLLNMSKRRVRTYIKENFPDFYKNNIF